MPKIFYFMNLSVYFREFSYNIKLAYPIIIAMLGHTLVGVIDNIMVGRIGATELAAASLANSFVFIALATGVGFSTAITPLIAATDAERNDKEGQRIFLNGLIVCTFLGVILFSVLFSLKPLINVMEQPEEVTRMAKPFLDIVGFSLIPAIAFQGLKQFSDGKSFTRYSMYATLIANIFNVIFNYCLIYGVWFFPEMGYMGVAYGTLLSRIIMLIYIYFALKSNATLSPFINRLTLKDFSWEKCKDIFKIGVPSGMQSLFEVGLFTGAVWLTGMIGTAAQAANQIALSMASLVFMFVSGLSVAAMIRVGNQVGLKDYKKMKIVAGSIMLMSIILNTFFAILFFIFHKQIPLLFINADHELQGDLSAEVIHIAGKLIIIAGLFQISDGIQVTILGSLRGLRDVTIPMILTFVSYWLVGYSICIYLGLYTDLGATGIWLGLLAGLTVAAIALYYRFRYMSDKLIQNT